MPPEVPYDHKAKEGRNAPRRVEGVVARRIFEVTLWIRERRRRDAAHWHERQGRAHGAKDADRLLVDLPNKIRDTLGLVAPVRAVSRKGNTLHSGQGSQRRRLPAVQGLRAGWQAHAAGIPLDNMDLARIDEALLDEASDELVGDEQVIEFGRGREGRGEEPRQRGSRGVTRGVVIGGGDEPSVGEEVGELPCRFEALCKFIGISAERMPVKNEPPGSRDGGVEVEPNGAGYNSLRPRGRNEPPPRAPNG